VLGGLFFSCFIQLDLSDSNQQYQMARAFVLAGMTSLYDVRQYPDTGFHTINIQSCNQCQQTYA